MGIRSTVFKAFFKVQINVLEQIVAMPTPLKKVLASILGYDKRLSHADERMKIIISANRLQNIPLISQNANTSRKIFQQRTCSVRSKPLPNIHTNDLTIDSTEHTIKIRHYKQTFSNNSTEDTGVILFFHGGGFVVGDIETHDSFCQYLCHYSQIPIISVDYRLAPEHPAPAAFEDCLTALHWVYNHAESMNIDTKKIYVAGDSAGGNLATVLCQQTKYDKITPAAQLLIYPVTDATKDYESYRDFGHDLMLTLKDKNQYEYFYIHAGKLKLDNPIISPMLGDITDIAPAYIVTAELDFLVDEGEAYAHKLRSGDIKTYTERMYGLPHGFIHFINLHPASKTATIKLAKGFKTFVGDLH